MADQRLNMWIPEELKVYLAERAKNEERGMNQIVVDLIRQEMARQQGAVVEQQSLPVIREIVQTELRKALAQQRSDLREDMNLEFTNELKALTRASDNRLAALMVRGLRDSNVARRLTYAMLARTHGPDFANRAYEDAREKAGRDLARRDDMEP